MNWIKTMYHFFAFGPRSGLSGVKVVRKSENRPKRPHFGKNAPALFLTRPYLQEHTRRRRYTLITFVKTQKIN